LWEASYKSGFCPWQRQTLNPAYAIWFDQQLVRGTTVVVPGCGTSLEPVEFARHGAIVTCLDIAPSAIEMQRVSFKQHKLDGLFVCADLAKWRPQEPVDVIYEQTCLCAIHPYQRHDYEHFAHDVLKPGGTFFGLFMQTGGKGGPPFHCAMEDMKALFPGGRWDWQQEEAVKSTHPLGVTELGYKLRRL
jgi:methyl halide transferase